MSAPPPPPPHGGGPKSSGLPPGKYDIFVIPEHSAGAGFLYLPSMRPNINSFAAGFASALILVVVCQSMAPAFRTWWENFHGLGNMAMAMMVIGVGFGAWSLGRIQQDARSSGNGSGTSGGYYNPGGFGGSTSNSAPNTGGPPPPRHSNGPAPPPHTDPPPQPPPQQDRPKSTWDGPPPPPPPQPDPRPRPQPPPQPPPQTPPQTPPPKAQPRQPPTPQSNNAEPPPKSKGSWEKAREEIRRKEEERKAKEAEQKRRDDAARRLAELRAREAKERLEREKEREWREREAKERRERLEAEKRAKDLSEKLEHERRERERLEREAKEGREARAAQSFREAREAKEALEREAVKQKEAREREELKQREAQEREEKRKKEAQEREERRKRLQQQRDVLRKREADESKAREELKKKQEQDKTEAELLASRKGSSYAFSGVGEKTSMWPNGRPAVPAQSTASSSTPRNPPPPSSAASNGNRRPVPPPASTTAWKSSTTKQSNPKSNLSKDEDAHSHRPYDKAKRPQHKKSTSSLTGSEASFAYSQTTAQTSAPPSARGPYSTKDPDKIVISAVYLFMNQYAKTPASQLISGIGSVTDGLILRITTEGLFIDDDVRGVPQREWDVKAWTLKHVEVWCPPHCLNNASTSTPARGPKSNPLFKMGASRDRDRGVNKPLTGDEADVYLTEMLRSCKDCCQLGLCERKYRDTNIPSPTGQTGEWKSKGLHVLRATVRDQEGKRYLFVIDEEESWKVAVGVQRLRRGTQVRQLGVSGMTPSDARGTLEMLGWDG
ncbi:hypothetical protein G7046_g10000 [Stylonectria norvegica]|nr:hypothetical protein G7046_g10000 [Stylonectria norvegica]